MGDEATYLASERYARTPRQHSQLLKAQPLHSERSTASSLIHIIKNNIDKGSMYSQCTLRLSSVDHEVFMARKRRSASQRKVHDNACSNHTSAERLPHTWSAFRAPRIESVYEILSRGYPEANVLTTVNVLDLVPVVNVGVAVVVV